MLLVERTEELAGARGASTTAYTLRFAHEASTCCSGSPSTAPPRGSTAGWSRPRRSTITVLRDADVLATLEVGDTGRFELPDLPLGLLRLRLEPDDDSTPFVTPAFEI